VAKSGATPALDAVVRPVEPGAVGTIAVPVAEAPLVAGYGEEALVAPVAVTPPGILAVSEAPLVEGPVTEGPVAEGPVAEGPVAEEAPLTEGPVAATAETEEAPAVEAPVTPLATEEAPDAVCATEAGLVKDAPEIAVPDEGPVAVAGRLAVPVWDTPEIEVDAPVPAPVGDTVFETPDNGADSVPVAPTVLLSPLNDGITEPCVPLGTEAVDGTTPGGPNTMLELDATLDKPDVGETPETSDACVNADGTVVLPPAVTTPDGPKTILEPVDDAGAAVGTGTLNDDAGAAVWEPIIELTPVGRPNVGLALGGITIGGTPLLEAELVPGTTLPVECGDNILSTGGILGKML
jgi:hypothetical protein